MNGKWIEIFRGGEQTDSQGQTHDGDKMIDDAVSLFNAAEHEPPAVIGHPKDNAPAFAWVDGLKREGDSLLAKFKDAQPEFVDMLERGLFKKRSAAFYANGMLRHVGFLGAMPPAVKGLADIKFNADEPALVFEFAQNEDYKFRALSRIISGLRDFIIEKFDLDTADKIANIFDIETISEPTEREASPLFSQPNESEDTMSGAATFSQEQLEEAKKQAADEAREQAKKEFMEKENDRVSRLEESLKKQKADLRKKEISNFIESGIKEGTILPAWKKAGLGEFMESLDHETEIEFSDSDGKTVKANQLDKFKEFMAVLPKAVNFDEISNGDGPDSSDDLDALAKEFSEKNNVNYKVALIEVGKKRPDLVGK